MLDISNNEMTEYRTSVIWTMTTVSIVDLTNEIEGYERMNPEKSEDEVLKLIRSKRWSYLNYQNYRHGEVGL